MTVKKGPFWGLLIIVLLNMCALWVSGKASRPAPVSSPRDSRSGSADTRVIEATAESDYYLLARLIEAECPGEPYSGQVAVGAVALNRLRHSSFPDSIAGVIYQPGAFASVYGGGIERPAGRLARRAAKDSLNGLDPTGGAIYYCSRTKASGKDFEGGVPVKIIGSRAFFR